MWRQISPNFQIACHFVHCRLKREADVPGPEFPPPPALASHFLPCFSVNEISEINISEMLMAGISRLPRDWARPKPLILLPDS